MLQKLLYFIQGESYALNGEPIFPENCQAWVHGPVYPEVYDMFRNFKFNPIEDARFAIFECAEDVLTEKEHHAIDLVVNTFGEYSGKVLERITHEETPWKLARRGYADGIPANEQISMESIKSYYTEKSAEYDFSTEKQFSYEGLCFQAFFLSPLNPCCIWGRCFQAFFLSLRNPGVFCDFIFWLSWLTVFVCYFYQFIILQTYFFIS